MKRSSERLRGAFRRWQSERHYQKILYATPYSALMFPIRFVLDRYKYGAIGYYVSRSRRIHSWTRDELAAALAYLSYALRPDAVIVQVGAFVGGAAVLLAGPRKLRGSGRYHAVDSFDLSGESFSAPVYQRIASTIPEGVRARFDRNIRKAGLTDWVTVHAAREEQASVGWTTPIDMLVLSADFSAAGARGIFDRWESHLRVGGLLALQNANDREYGPNHEGNHALVKTTIGPPKFSSIWYVADYAFAIKLA